MRMAIQLDMADYPTAQIRIGARSNVEILPGFIVLNEAFDSLTDVVAVNDFRERLC